jgi:hypothetical protein
MGLYAEAVMCFNTMIVKVTSTSLTPRYLATYFKTIVVTVKQAGITGYINVPKFQNKPCTYNVALMIFENKAPGKKDEKSSWTSKFNRLSRRFL